MSRQASHTPHGVAVMPPVPSVPMVMLGKHGRFPEVWMGRTDRIYMKGSAPIAIHSDGELRSPGATELTVTLHAGRLPVIKAGGR